MMRNRCVFSLALLMLGLTVAALAQQPATQQPVATLKIQAREVVLPVTVGALEHLYSHAPEPPLAGGVSYLWHVAVGVP